MDISGRGQDVVFSFRLQDPARLEILRSQIMKVELWEKLWKVRRELLNTED